MHSDKNRYNNDNKEAQRLAGMAGGVVGISEADAQGTGNTWLMEQDKKILSEVDYVIMQSLENEYARYNELNDYSGMDAVMRAQAAIRQKSEYNWEYEFTDSNGVFFDTNKYNSEKITTVIDVLAAEITSTNVNAHNGVRDKNTINASLYIVGLLPGGVGTTATLGSFAASDDKSLLNAVVTAHGLAPKPLGQLWSTLGFINSSDAKPIYDVNQGDIYVMISSRTDRGNKITVTENYYRDNKLNHYVEPRTTEIEGRYRSVVSKDWKFD